MQRNFIEKRRRRPSYSVPLLFYILEIALMYLLLSLFNWSVSVFQWNMYSYIIAFVWLLYSSLKLYFVLKRQKSPHV